MSTTNNNQDASVSLLRKQLQQDTQKEEKKQEFEINPWFLRLTIPEKKGDKFELNVRILPNPNNEGNNPIKVMHYVYNLGKYYSVLSLKSNFGESDPLDDYKREIFGHANLIAKKLGIDKDRDAKKSNPQIAQLFKLAYQYDSVPRYYCPVVARSGEQEGKIAFWGMTENVYKELESILEEFDETEVPFGRYEGWDVKITVENTGQERNGRVLPKYSIKVLSMKAKTSCLPGKSSEEIDEFISQIPSVESILESQKKSFDEVLEIATYVRTTNEELLASIMNPGGSNVSSVQVPTTPVQPTQVTSKEGVESLKKELDEQLGIE